MLKVMIRRQFRETFRGYFVDKKNRTRTKAGTIGYFVLYVLLMVMLFAMFFAAANQLSVLIGAGLKWLYFALMGILTVAMGIFGSVFNTYAGLYLPKDNDLLFSLPIPPATILTARMIHVFGVGLLYAAPVWIPTLVRAWMEAAPSLPEILFGVLLLPIIMLFVTALTCILGWIVALVSVRVKNRSFVVVILTLGFIVLYNMFVMNSTEILENMLFYGEAAAGAVKKWGSLFYHLGNAASGNALSMLLFTVISVLLCAGCIWVLSKSFISLSTKVQSSGKTSGKTAVVKVRGYRTALLRRERQRFTASPTYMMNSALGTLVLPAGAVYFLIKAGTIRATVPGILEALPEWGAFIPLGVFFLAAAVCCMNMIATPSVSLEGKNLWILHSLPIPPADVLEAKVNLHTLLTLIPALISVPVFCIVLEVAPLSILLVLAALIPFVRLCASIDLMIGLKYANTEWTRETQPVKGLTSLLAMLVNFALAAVLGGLFWVLRDQLTPDDFFIGCVVILMAAVRLTDRWLRTKGAARFAEI